MRLRISARQSDLARLQAYRVGKALENKGEHTVEYAFRASLGDINQNDPLWKMPEKGVFTEDFLRDLTEGMAELVVHSWKDLPTQPRPETEIIATLPRADVRDVLLFRRDREERVRSLGEAKILTSSPRRSHNLGSFLKSHLPFGVSSVAFEPVRGNIPTRLKKLLAQDVDGLIVAKAALDRLLAAPEAEFAEVQGVIREALARTRFMVLPISVNPTAAAQGALAIEVSKARPDVREAIVRVNCEETFACVDKERRILASHGGGCHQKIGVNVLRRSYGEITFVRGLTDAGQVLDSIELVPRQDIPAQPKAASPEALFPRVGEETGFFEREFLPRAAWASGETEPYLWISRETALPTDFRVGEKQIVWTAGLKTWEKLAARGIWVSGSAEGLGEREATRIETLLGATRIEWLKLSHEDAAEFSQAQGETSSETLNSPDAALATEAMRALATYRLVPRAETPNLKGRTHFFWMSGSSFERALTLFPEIKSAHHASGPGHTHDYLRRRLGPSASISVHLGIEAWRDSLKGH